MGKPSVANVSDISLPIRDIYLFSDQGWVVHDYGKCENVGTNYGKILDYPATQVCT